MKKLKLIGPFRQILTMDDLPRQGPLSDIQLEIIENAGILVGGEIIETVGSFNELKSLASSVENINGDYTVIPGMIDVHTHICWAGSRAGDYAIRLLGEDYLQVAKRGGGIWSTVTKTREATEDQLRDLTVYRADKLLKQGITTIEVKSGYGLNTESELKMLRAIRSANKLTPADLIPTCLAAHIKPKDFKGPSKQYLRNIVEELLPEIKSQNLSTRVDVYIDNGAFTVSESYAYLAEAAKLGFDVVVHADQFSGGGLIVATEIGAVSADHLEMSNEEDILMLSRSKVIPVVLPGSSLGLGHRFAPARKILNSGCSLVIASDWNPGSAPMGKLLTAATILGVYEKLNMAETLAAITCRAAPALKLNDRGILKAGMLADFIAFPCSSYKEIIYNQGGLMPEVIWKKGRRVMG
jgi:imidazolonepropionase